MSSAPQERQNKKYDWPVCCNPLTYIGVNPEVFEGHDPHILGWGGIVDYGVSIKYYYILLCTLDSNELCPGIDTRYDNVQDFEIWTPSKCDDFSEIDGFANKHFWHDTLNPVLCASVSRIFRTHDTPSFQTILCPCWPKSSLMKKIEFGVLHLSYANFLWNNWFLSYEDNYSSDRIIIIITLGWLKDKD